MKKKKTRKKTRPPSKTKKLDPRVQVQKAVTLFKRYYPEAHCALRFSNPLELLVATILSAQCTDQRVNIVTETLFRKYPTAKDYAQADVAALEADIRSTGFFKNKARNIKSCANTLVEKFKGEVPQTMPEMLELAGVGRKTANVVLGNAFAIPSGVVVDTHVTRLCNRLGLVKTENAEKIEQQLLEILDREDWILFPHWMIHHGRTICKARKPRCDVCFLSEFCPRIGVI